MAKDYNRNEYCDMCKERIMGNLEVYRIKKRFVCQDYDGWWQGHTSVLICQNCINKIKEGFNNER